MYGNAHAAAMNAHTLAHLVESVPALRATNGVLPRMGDTMIVEDAGPGRVRIVGYDMANGAEYATGDMPMRSLVAQPEYTMELAHAKLCDQARAAFQ